jgi:hypothetical protein
MFPRPTQTRFTAEQKVSAAAADAEIEAKQEHHALVRKYFDWRNEHESQPLHSFVLTKEERETFKHSPETMGLIRVMEEEDRIRAPQRHAAARGSAIAGMKSAVSWAQGNLRGPELHLEITKLAEKLETLTNAPVTADAKNAVLRQVVGDTAIPTDAAVVLPQLEFNMMQRRFQVLYSRNFGNFISNMYTQQPERSVLRRVWTLGIMAVDNLFNECQKVFDDTFTVLKRSQHILRTPSEMEWAVNNLLQKHSDDVSYDPLFKTYIVPESLNVGAMAETALRNFYTKLPQDFKVTNETRILQTSSQWFLVSLISFYWALITRNPPLEQRVPKPNDSFDSETMTRAEGTAMNGCTLSCARLPCVHRTQVWIVRFPSLWRIESRHPHLREIGRINDRCLVKALVETY